jgi:ADP-ribosyl-[dinitrogen reductase] hydrolase
MLRRSDPQPPSTRTDRARGCLLGLATGDALGTTLEFTRPGQFEPISDLAGGGPFRLQPGQWTDDTSMALCLAESLVECRGFDPSDQMRRYLRWWREGHLSSTGRCFDIGLTVSAALRRYERTGEPFAGPTEPTTAGNGSLMRLAPVPIAYDNRPAEAVRLAGESSRTTHGAAEAVDACRYFAWLLLQALEGRPKAEVLESPLPKALDGLSPKIAAIAAGSYRPKTHNQIRASGYVVHTLEAVLWAFWNSDNFRDGALMAVNLGEDADTTGAVYGQLAGAFYGEAGIPAEWREKLAMRETIVSLAEKLLQVP